MTRAAGTSADVIRGAFALTFLRPESWLAAAAGFLARGGLVLLTIPILVLPTAAETSALLGPLVGRFVTGSVDAPLMAGIIVALLVATVVVVLLLLVGGMVDGWMIATASDDLGREPAGHGRASAGRLALARALAFLPLVVGLALASLPIVDVATDELLRPADLANPVVLRVAARLSWLAACLVVLAALCDLVASLATRALALDGSTIVGSIGAALRTVRRRPGSVALALSVTLLLTLVLLLPAVVALAGSFGGVVTGAADPAIVVVGAVILVVCWLGTLVVAGFAAAFRSFAWTSVYVGAWPMPSTHQPSGQSDRLLAP